MFEDATFETMGTIQTRSRRWMIATFGLNCSILLALAMIPLLYPKALSRVASIMVMEAPTTPVEETRPVAREERAPQQQAEMRGHELVVPSRIPRIPYIPSRPEEPMPDTVMALGGGPSGPANPFGGHGTHPDVHPAAPAAQHVTSVVMQGMLIRKVLPTYSPIAIATRVTGTVVLQATISRTGTIENLRVLGGPALLQQPAIDAVKQWRYKPYVLDGQPVEVETTINVEFKMN